MPYVRQQWPNCGPLGPHFLDARPFDTRRAFPEGEFFTVRTLRFSKDGPSAEGNPSDPPGTSQPFPSRVCYKCIAAPLFTRRGWATVDRRAVECRCRRCGLASSLVSWPGWQDF